MKRRWGDAITLDHKLFEVVESDFGGGNRDSKLLPLAGETLAKENTLSGLAGLADGVFVLEGLLVNSDGTARRRHTSTSSCCLCPIHGTSPSLSARSSSDLLDMRLGADRVARASILDDYTVALLGMTVRNGCDSELV